MASPATSPRDKELFPRSKAFLETWPNDGLYLSWIRETFQKVSGRRKGPIGRITEKPKTVFYDDLIILFGMLRLIGAFPFLKQKNGEIKSEVCSFLTLYSFLVVVAGVLASYFSHRDIFVWLFKHNFSFDDNFLFVGPAIFMGALILPVLVFFERKKIVSYFALWSDYEMKYNNITGNKLEIRTRKLQAIVVTVMLIFVVTTFYFISHSSFIGKVEPKGDQAFGSGLRIGYAIMLSFYGWLTMGYGSLWSINLRCVMQAAKQLLDCIKGENTPHNIDDISFLWVELKDLCTKIGISFCWTYLFFLTFTFLLILSAAYASFIAFQKETDSTVRYMRIIFALLIFTYMSAIGNIAHITTDMVGKDFQRTLLLMAASETDPIQKWKYRNFAVDIARNPPDVSLNGFITLNRTFNAGMYSTVISYMVVVLQFRVSGS